VGRFARRDPGGQHAVDDHQLGPQLRRDAAHVEGDLRPGGDRHHLGGLLLECSLRVWIGTAPVADDVEARVEGRLPRGGRRENADPVVASGEQRARGKERRQVPSPGPAHDQNIKTRRALVHASTFDPIVCAIVYVSAASWRAAPFGSPERPSVEQAAVSKATRPRLREPER
jgi:hypothetical protein